MDIIVNVPNYSPDKGFIFNWSDNFEITAKVEKGEIRIKANKEGLVSLANHLLNLAQDDVPKGYHLQLDEYNYSLEEGSVPLIIEKQ